MLPYATSRHLMPPHATACHLTPPHVTSRHLTPAHVSSCAQASHRKSPHATAYPPHATSRQLMPPHATSRHAFPPHASAQSIVVIFAPGEVTKQRGAERGAERLRALQRSNRALVVLMSLEGGRQKLTNTGTCARESVRACKRARMRAFYNANAGPKRGLSNFAFTKNQSPKGKRWSPVPLPCLLVC